MASARATIVSSARTWGAPRRTPALASARQGTPVDGTQTVSDRIVAGLPTPIERTANESSLSHPPARAARPAGGCDRRGRTDPELRGPGTRRAADRGGARGARRRTWNGGRAGVVARRGAPDRHAGRRAAGCGVDAPRLRRHGRTAARPAATRGRAHHRRRAAAARRRILRGLRLRRGGPRADRGCRLLRRARLGSRLQRPALAADPVVRHDRGTQAGGADARTRAGPLVRPELPDPVRRRHAPVHDDRPEHILRHQPLPAPAGLWRNGRRLLREASRGLLAVRAARRHPHGRVAVHGRAAGRPAARRETAVSRHAPAAGRRGGVRRAAGQAAPPRDIEDHVHLRRERARHAGDRGSAAAGRTAGRRGPRRPLGAGRGGRRTGQRARAGRDRRVALPHARRLLRLRG